MRTREELLNHLGGIDLEPSRDTIKQLAEIMEDMIYLMDDEPVMNGPKGVVRGEPKSVSNPMGYLLIAVDQFRRELLGTTDEKERRASLEAAAMICDVIGNLENGNRPEMIERMTIEELREMVGDTGEVFDMGGHKYELVQPQNDKDGFMNALKMAANNLARGNVTECGYQLSDIIDSFSPGRVKFSISRGERSDYRGTTNVD